MLCEVGVWFQSHINVSNLKGRNTDCLTCLLVILMANCPTLKSAFKRLRDFTLYWWLVWKSFFLHSVLHCLLITCYLEKWQHSTVSTNKNHTLLFSLETFGKRTAFPAVQYIRIDQSPLFPDMSSIPSLIAISCTALLCVQHGEWRRVKGRSPE